MAEKHTKKINRKAKRQARKESVYLIRTKLRKEKERKKMYKWGNMHGNNETGRKSRIGGGRLKIIDGRRENKESAYLIQTKQVSGKTSQRG